MDADEYILLLGLKCGYQIEEDPLFVVSIWIDGGRQGGLRPPTTAARLFCCTDHSSTIRDLYARLLLLGPSNAKSLVLCLVFNKD